MPAGPSPPAVAPARAAPPLTVAPVRAAVPLTPDDRHKGPARPVTSNTIAPRPRPVHLHDGSHPTAPN
jgi:hypothetical protein